MNSAHPTTPKRLTSFNTRWERACGVRAEGKPHVILCSSKTLELAVEFLQGGWEHVLRSEVR
jgi:hypothetical protein